MSVSLIDGHIDDDVMTDEQIIKALECHKTDYDNACIECPYIIKGCSCEMCKDTLGLINRQKAEIERLKQDLHACVKEVSRSHEIDRHKGIREFAERLKEYKIDIDVSFGYGREVYTEAVAVIEIDNLVKEMVGAESG